MYLRRSLSSSKSGPSKPSRYPDISVSMHRCSTFAPLCNASFIQRFALCATILRLANTSPNRGSFSLLRAISDGIHATLPFSLSSTMAEPSKSSFSLNFMLTQRCSSPSTREPSRSATSLEVSQTATSGSRGSPVFMCCLENSSSGMPRVAARRCASLCLNSKFRNCLRTSTWSGVFKPNCFISLGSSTFLSKVIISLLRYINSALLSKASLSLGLCSSAFAKMPSMSP